MIRDLKLILASIVAFFVAAYYVFKSGKDSQKNKQIAKDLHAADDAKQRKEEISNLDDDDFVTRVRESER